jgi:hypothetical protein
MTTVSTAAILAAFQNNLNPDLEYGLAEIKKILSDSYKAVKASQAPVKEKKVKLDANGDVKPKKTRVKRDRDADGNIIKKRAPSAYNLFVAEKMAIIRASNPGTDNKEIFKMAIALWHEAKASIAKESSDAEPKAKADDEPKAKAEADDEPKAESDTETKAESDDEPKAESDTEANAESDDDNVPTITLKKPAKKGRKPKVSNVVADDSE